MKKTQMHLFLVFSSVVLLGAVAIMVLMLATVTRERDTQAAIIASQRGVIDELERQRDAAQRKLAEWAAEDAPESGSADERAVNARPYGGMWACRPTLKMRCEMEKDKSERQRIFYEELTPETPLCVNCEHWVQHYRKVHPHPGAELGFAPLDSGHCRIRVKACLAYDACGRFMSAGALPRQNFPMHRRREWCEGG